jgi:hypothetical protein
MVRIISFKIVMFDIILIYNRKFLKKIISDSDIKFDLLIDIFI